MIHKIKNEISQGIGEFLDICSLMPGDILVVGCSTSEVAGRRIGTDSNLEIGQILFNEIYLHTQKRRIFLAAQCCEHLNRALVIEREALLKYSLEEVNVIPKPKAGGSFATAAYNRFLTPVIVETIKAHAAIDIGNTLIGMHLLPVAVPVRLAIGKIGHANLTCARTRPKFIGGARAIYDERLL